MLNKYFYYQCWKKLYCLIYFLCDTLFQDSLINRKEQSLFEIVTLSFCNINIFTFIFDQFNESMMNIEMKVLIFFIKILLLGCTVIFFAHSTSATEVESFVAQAKQL